MTNLTQIETEFLSSTEVRNHVPINQIQNLSQQIGNAKKSKFEKMINIPNDDEELLLYKFRAN